MPIVRSALDLPAGDSSPHNITITITEAYDFDGHTVNYGDALRLAVRRSVEYLPSRGRAVFKRVRTDHEKDRGLREWHFVFEVSG